MPLIHWLLLLAPAFGFESNVTIQTFKFRPDTVVVAAGIPVVWTNADEIEHTVTSDSSSSVTLKATLAGKGSTFRTTFARPGIYTYHCERHAFMRGAVRVTAPIKGVRP